MYVSTVMLKCVAPMRDVSGVPFRHWHRIHYVLITLVFNLMEILNEDAAHLSGHTE